MLKIVTKRIYEKASEADGTRILVDRLWPRGISKDKAKINYWARNAAPSTELRKRFHQQLCSQEQFRKDYFAELDANVEGLDELRFRLAQDKVVTFLFSSKDVDFNHATVLKEYLDLHP